MIACGMDTSKISSRGQILPLYHSGFLWKHSKGHPQATQQLKVCWVT